MPLFRRAHLVTCLHLANTDPWSPRKGTWFFPQCQHWASSPDFYYLRRERPSLRVNPRSSEPCPQKPACMSPERTVGKAQAYGVLETWVSIHPVAFWTRVTALYPPPRPQCSKTGCCGLKPTRLARTNQSRHWRSPGGPSWAGPEPFACGAGTECVVHALCASQSENWPATHLPSSIQAPSTVLDTSCLHPKVKCVSWKFLSLRKVHIPI